MKKTTLFAALFIAVFLTSCQPEAKPAPAPTQPIPVATLTPSATAVPPTAIPTLTITPTPAPPINRVLLVTFDGLRPDAIYAAEMRNVISLMENGAFTLTARTIMPSVTLPAHASLVTGVCPAKHIVRWNEYVPENGYAIGTDIFDLAHAAGLQTAMVVGKEKLQQVTEPSSLDFFAFVDKTDKIEDNYSLEQLASAQITRGFNLMLLHFPDGDIKGHEHGWMSQTQLIAYHYDDQEFGRILEALKQSGAYDSTIIIITSDHGGHETTHGYDIPDDMMIPWIISGPRVKPGLLGTQVNLTDTAATAAFALGLPLPEEWDGVPVFEAFGLPVTKQSEPCR